MLINVNCLRGNRRRPFPNGTDRYSTAFFFLLNLLLPVHQWEKVWYSSTLTNYTKMASIKVQMRRVAVGVPVLCGPQEWGERSSSRCLAWSCWSLEALGFQEEAEGCGIYLSLELVMTIRNETCTVHYRWPSCAGLLLKSAVAQCVVWSELRADGMLQVAE